MYFAIFPGQRKGDLKGENVSLKFLCFLSKLEKRISLFGLSSMPDAT